MCVVVGSLCWRGDGVLKTPGIDFPRRETSKNGVFVVGPHPHDPLPESGPGPAAARGWRPVLASSWWWWHVGDVDGELVI